ncbi:MAG TPA: hybrid sensor histidine kinase/response regulator, partial [Anaerolineae bacterium]|nr:hybrid sensor histidine kinase/response regulator [Anaerolineae bacterium]
MGEEGMTMQKILYVEDSPDARRLVRRLLSDRYLVLEAEDGLTGIEVTWAEEPTLILIDINIPYLDGYEVATKLKSLRPEVPIVALTADISDGARQRALAAGCDGYIPKPIDPDQFPAQVEAFLKGRREVLEQGERRAYTQAYQQKLVDRLEEKVRELTKANEGLKELDRMKDEFISIAAHELYTPLSILLGYAVMAKEEATGEIQRYLEIIVDKSLQLQEVIGCMLDLKYLQTGGSLLKLEKVSLKKLIEAVVDELNLLTETKRQVIELDLPEDLPEIETDRRRFNLILSNLLSNASKFTPEGGKIRIEGRVGEGEVAVSVRDTGIGIPVGEREKIFAPFYQVEDSLTRTHGGLGLGLAIVQSAVATCGGRIWV